MSEPTDRNRIEEHRTGELDKELTEFDLRREAQGIGLDEDDDGRDTIYGRCTCPGPVGHNYRTSTDRDCPLHGELMEDGMEQDRRASGTFAEGQARLGRAINEATEWIFRRVE